MNNINFTYKLKVTLRRLCGFEKLKQQFENYWGLSNAFNREKFVKKWMFSLKKDSFLLDAGAGEQGYKKYAQHLKYTSQDFGIYEGAKQSGDFFNSEWQSKSCDIICDITDIPRSDSSFDNILCTEVFEHIPNPTKALTELSRLLKVNGQMLITAPFRCLYHQVPYFFYSGFSKYWYEHFAKENNLEIICIMPNGNYFQDLAQEVYRISTFQSFPLRMINLLFTVPFFCFLLFMDKITNIKTPESCWGYHVVFQKKNKLI